MSKVDRPFCFSYQAGNKHIDIVHILEDVILNQKVIIAVLRGQNQVTELAETERRIEEGLTAIYLVYEEMNKRKNLITIVGDSDPNVPLGKS
jgi:hypothetical protein